MGLFAREFHSEANELECLLQELLTRISKFLSDILCFAKSSKNSVIPAFPNAQNQTLLSPTTIWDVQNSGTLASPTVPNSCFREGLCLRRFHFVIMWNPCMDVFIFDQSRFHILEFMKVCLMLACCIL